MGWRFNIDHANFVNYLTLENRAPFPKDGRIPPAPRATVAQLQNFIEGLISIGGYERYQYGIPPFIGGSDLISSRGDWLDSVREAAKNVRNQIGSLEVRPGAILDSPVVA